MKIEFKTESEAMSFMSFLMDQNNQGHKQVLYSPLGLKGVEYEFYNVIHDDLYERVDSYLNNVDHQVI